MPANIPTTCLLDKILDVIWPRKCEVCGCVSDRAKRMICTDCLNRLPFIPVRGCCRQCGRVAEKLDSDYLCEECRANKPAFDRAASSVYFEEIARELVNRYKFRGALWLRNDFVDWMEGTLRARFMVNEIDAFCAVPITRWHYLNRGYNQCDYLAKALAKRCEKPYSSRLMKRTGSPKRQGGLDEQGRRANVVGTFAVRKPMEVRGKTIMVVDDIMTTGSTLSECAAELKKAGARQVWCITLAKSVRL